MISILFIVLLGLAGYFLSKYIVRVKYLLYGLFLILGILSIIFRDVVVSVPINRGYLGFAFFYIVMITGLFKHETKFHNNLTAVRSIYSIIGFIILTPHIIYYFIDKFANNGVFEIVGLIAYIVMIPLFITSFQKVDDVKVKIRWKKLQRLAYIVYLLIFIHLILISEIPNLIMYIVLFVPYILYKPFHFIKHEKPYYVEMKKKMLENNNKNLS